MVYDDRTKGNGLHKENKGFMQDKGLKFLPFCDMIFKTIEWVFYKYF